MKKINLILSLTAVALFAACSGSTDSAAADTAATQDTAAAGPAATSTEATVAPAPEAEEGTTIKVDPNSAEIKTDKGSVEASKEGIEIKKP